MAGDSVAQWHWHRLQAELFGESCAIIVVKNPDSDAYVIMYMVRV